jgi:hypothetical protein
VDGVGDARIDPQILNYFLSNDIDPYFVYSFVLENIFVFSNEKRKRIIWDFSLIERDFNSIAC